MRPWNAEISADETQTQWNPLLWDGIAQFYPWRVHYSRSLIDGEIPLWNPHQFSGTPFAANAQTAVFYPLNLLFVLFSPTRAFGVSAFLHLFLAGVFAFLLARSLGIGRFGATIAGITYEFSAFMIVWLELPTLINVATWLPLALYLILRSMDRTGPIHAIFAGLALGLAVLAGHFQIASYVLGAALLWWIWLIVPRARIDGFSAIKRGAFLVLISFGTAFLIAAPQILQTLELAGLSHRVRDVTTAGYAAYIGNAVPLRNLITLFAPYFYGDPAANTYWNGSAANFIEYGMYIGLLPLILAIFGALFTIRWRTVGYFVVLAVFSLLLAIGTPLNYLIYHLVPGTSALGGPNRILVLFCFAGAMLAGFGGHWFAQLAQEEYRATKRRLGYRALTVGGAVFFGLFIVAQSLASAQLTELGIDPNQAIAAAFGQYLLFAALLLAGLAVLGLYTAGLLPKPFFAGLVILVIIADLFAFGIRFNPKAPVEQVYPETELTTWLKQNAGHGRLMPINSTWSLYDYPEAILPPNSATVYELYDMQGYDSLFPRLYKQFVDNHLEMDSSPRENGNMLFIKSYVRDWPLGTAGYVLSEEPLDQPDLELAFESESGVNVYRRQPFDQYRQVYLLSASQQSEADAGEKPTGRAWITDRTPNEVTVQTDTDERARLVLADTFYPGWIAEVDGVKKPISIAQGIFKAVEIESGEHTVVFKFQPGTFVVGMFLGLIGAMTVGLGAGMAIRRRRR